MFSQTCSGTIINQHDFELNKTEYKWKWGTALLVAEKEDEWNGNL